MEMIDKTALHDASLYLLYGAALLATFVVLERLVYFAVLFLRCRGIARTIGAAGEGTLPAPAAFAGGDPFNRALAEYVGLQAGGQALRGRVDDLSGALVLDVESRIGARLWLLDTVITAAPLLGLLGTILGIMDTFATLASTGISDPGAVSRGIGQALFATALGIGVALYGLVFFNLLQRLVDVLGERFRGFLLRTTA